MSKVFVKLKKSLAVLIMFCMIISIFPMNTLAAAAPDITGHWAQSTIQRWIDQGLITTYPDGKFKPDNYISRAEFVNFVNKTYGFTSTASISFPDVQIGDWYYNAISVAVAKGYITGYPDGTMKPTDPITREGAAAIIMKINDLTSNPAAAAALTDSSSFTWSKGAIGAVLEANIMKGMPDGSFGPLKFITRAEAVIALDRAAPSLAITSIATMNVTIGDTVIIPVIPINPNNAMLAYSTTNVPSGATMIKDGIVYWIPKAAGSYSFNVVVNNMTARTDTSAMTNVMMNDQANDQTTRAVSRVTVNVTASTTQVPAVIQPIALGLSKVGSAILYQVVAIDANGDNLNYSLNHAPSGALISKTTGTLTWTPKTSGNYTFDVVVSDGKSSSVRTVNIAVVDDYDIVTQWNIGALNYLNSKGISNQYASRALAMIHTAMFDAINSVSNRYHPYHLYTASPTASPEAAASTAAYTVLTTLYPADTATFGAIYNKQMAAIPDGQPKSEGIALGQTTARDIISLRSNDNSAKANIPYTDGTLPGEYRNTGMKPMLPGWGDVTPWVLTDGSQFRLAGPPALTSAEYAEAYNETKELGAKNSTTRTVQQSEDALFWISGVPDHWYGIAREVSAKKDLTMIENARLFALLSMSLADASIAGWDTKYFYGFWRPITAIKNGALDGNDATLSDSAWQPFITTPAFPEYGSGHSTTCSTAASLLAGFFGSDTANFTRTSSTAGLPAHEYTSFSEIAQEAGASRIPAGAHFTFSNLEALAAGSLIGDYVFNNALQPLAS